MNKVNFDNDSRIIHYCWFGPNNLPPKLERCIDTWRQLMPEWEILLWNENNFDISSLPWTKAAYEAGKYAFVSDYVRLKALFDFGGIYLDTDVKLCKSLTHLVEKYGSFTGFENGRVLTSSLISASKGHPLIARFMDYYIRNEFNKNIISSNDANVRMMTDICMDYGLLTNNIEQDLYIRSGESVFTFHVFPRTYFCPLDFYHNENFTDKTHSIHLFEASWLDDDVKFRINRERTPIYKKMNRFKADFAAWIKKYLK